MRKILALLLALCLMAALISGCGAKEPAAVEPEASQPAETEAAPTEGDAAPVEAEPSAEPEPQFKEANWPLAEEESFTMFFPWFFGMIELGYEDPSTVQFYQELQKRTNVAVEYQPISMTTISETFNLLVASDEYPDMFMQCADYYTGGTDKAIDDEVWLDLTPYINTAAPNYWQLMEDEPAFKKFNVSDAGNIVQFRSFYDNCFVNVGCVIRQDWLDAIGMDKPVTYDDWDAALSAIKTEYNPKLPSMVGLPTQGFQTGDYMVFDGKVVFNWLQEETAKMNITMQNDWYNKGYFDLDAVMGNYTMQDSRDMSMKGDGAIFQIDVDQMKTYVESSDDPGYSLSGITWPVLKEGDVPYPGSIQQISGNGVCVSTDCENPELAVQWLDFWWTEDSILLANYGVEGISFEYDENGKPQYTDTVLNYANGFNTALGVYCLDWGPSRIDWDRKLVLYDDVQRDALACWSIANEEGMYPLNAQMTPEENEEFATKSTDISTYVEEFMPKFITGEYGLDKYPEFCDTILSLGVEDCIAIKQAAYDRYMAR